MIWIAAADAEVARRQHVGAAELEHQEHVRAPFADALDRDQLGDHGRRRRAPRGARARASRRARARRASAGRSSSRATGRRGAQLLGVGGEHLLGCRRLVVEVPEQPQPDRARGLRRQLLADDRAHQCGVMFAGLRRGRSGRAAATPSRRSIRAPRTGSAVRRCALARSAIAAVWEHGEQLLEAGQLHARAAGAARRARARGGRSDPALVVDQLGLAARARTPRAPSSPIGCGVEQRGRPRGPRAADRPSRWRPSCWSRSRRSGRAWPSRRRTRRGARARPRWRSAPRV